MREFHHHSGGRIRLALGLAAVIALGAASIRATGGGTNGFLLGGTAVHALDPENPANDVIKIDTTSPDPLCAPPTYQNCRAGTVSRTLNTKIAFIDNMLELKAYFKAPRGCGGGSPRVQLAIDLDGDGLSNGNAHGNYGPLAFGGGCPPPGMWDYQDLTDLAPRWDVSQLVAPGELVLPPGTNVFLVPWDLLEMLVSGFASHKVCTAALVDDSAWTPTAEGVAYYDLISMGGATWVDRSDTGGRGFAMGCITPDHDDDDHDGDEDHDHDYDDDDRDDKHRRRHGDD
jgi:hypothetical protein